MNPRDFGRRADLVRAVPLETVLLLRGAVRDRRDKSKWRTERGPLSVTGSQFMNWGLSHGGGGAIDLVMHLAGVDFRTAVQWLERHAAVGNLVEKEEDQAGGRVPCLASARPLVASAGGDPFRLPARDDRQLPRVCAYLENRRRVSAALLAPLVESGRLYADGRGNAVFVLMRGKPNQPVGAELRGTGPRVWRGMAAGSRKDLGCFWVGDSEARLVVLCESAIDAISCFQLRGSCICLSTSGVRADPGWLPGLIARGYEIFCGFDTDDAGEAAASHMIALYPVIQRLRPSAHDWNDMLTARS